MEVHSAADHLVVAHAVANPVDNKAAALGAEILVVDSPEAANRWEVVVVSKAAIHQLVDDNEAADHAPAGPSAVDPSLAGTESAVAPRNEMALESHSCQERRYQVGQILANWKQAECWTVRSACLPHQPLQIRL